MQKMCKRCRTDKPLDDFHNNRNSPDGHVDYCKSCCRLQKQEYWARRKMIKTRVKPAYMREYTPWSNPEKAAVRLTRRMAKTQDVAKKAAKYEEELIHELDKKKAALKRHYDMLLKHFEAENEPDLYKKCNCCEELLPLSDFGRYRQYKYGLHPFCKTCANTAKRLRYTGDQRLKDILRKQTYRNKNWEKVRKSARLQRQRFMEVPSNRRRVVRKSAKSRREMSDSYIKDLIKRQFGQPEGEIPPDYIKIRRAILRAKRIARELNEAKDETV